MPASERLHGALGRPSPTGPIGFWTGFLAGPPLVELAYVAWPGVELGARFSLAPLVARVSF